MKNSTIYNEGKKNSKHCLLSSSSSITLTTYKKDVDKIVYFGLTKQDFEEVNLKLKKQKEYLEYNYLTDKITGAKIPLNEIIISANHNSHRYYGQIQNRMNTLIGEATKRDLKPIFMTLTLPSKFHAMKTNKKTKQLIYNPKYNNTSPKEAIKELTKMFSRLRHDRSLKELSKANRVYFRVNEAHKDGTPHTHILIFVPQENIERIINAFKRLYNSRGNDIQINIDNATAYIMKYINKTLPLSKQDNLTMKEKYLNAWYSKHRIIRFNSSRTLAPLNLYRLLHEKYSLSELTQKVNLKHLDIFVQLNNKQKIMEVFDGEELIYRRNENYSLKHD